MDFIKVWCEFDISGEFGGNNNEEVFIVAEGVDVKEALIKRYGYLVEECELESIDELLTELMGWEYITVEQL